MKIKTVHCFFEQSGTFKNVFKKYGIDSYDYDILNEFGETDFCVDLFSEIDNAFSDKPSLFDKIITDDLIFAFFPCTRFETMSVLTLKAQSYQFKNYSPIQKLEYAHERHKELHRLDDLFFKFFIICEKRKLRLILENPYQHDSFLVRYFCFKPSIIDKDRSKHGDFYKKPTMFYFLNCYPERVLFLEYEKNNYLDVSINQINGNDRKTKRSLISTDYADWFIRNNVIGDDVNG